jgi:hypothetical protein
MIVQKRVTEKAKERCEAKRRGKDNSRGNEYDVDG